MKRILIVSWAAMLLVVGGVLAVQPWEHVTAQEQNTIHLVPYALSDADEEDGNECRPWGFFDTTLELLPFRQLIVTDHRGDIVGAIDLDVGVYSTEDNGQQNCIFTTDVRVEDAPFYTFTVDGIYRRTVSREDLADMNWELFVPLL